MSFTWFYINFLTELILYALNLKLTNTARRRVTLNIIVVCVSYESDRES